MHIIRKISEIPQDFHDFLTELARGYASIYGKEASRHYRDRVGEALNQILVQPGAAGFAAFLNKSCVGFCIGTRQGDRARLDFIHRLAGYENRGIEGDLIQCLVETLDTDAPDWISIEVIPLCALELSESLNALGFYSVERALMVKSLDGTAESAQHSRTQPAPNPTDPEIAKLLFSAFAEQNSATPTPSFSTIEDVHLLIRNYIAGEFGPHRPAWIRVVQEDDAVAGVILGSAQSLDTGFVFQVAVAPGHTQRGLGTALMLELESEFRRIGMSRIMLGVTVTSPARQWYESLGYQILRPVRVYYRRRGVIPGMP